MATWKAAGYDKSYALSQNKEQTLGSLLWSFWLRQQTFRLTVSVIQFYSWLQAAVTGCQYVS